MFKKTAGAALVDLLIEWGVEHVYGMPGDSINSIIEELRKRQDKIKFIQVRHEEAGALAAAAYAKLTGKLGVCLAIAGPGAIHLLNGLYDAKLDHAPVLAICGQIETDLHGTDFFQEVKLDRLFDDVAVYNQTLMSAEQVPVVVNQAIRKAYARQGVSVLIVPDDVPKFEIEAEARYTNQLVAQTRLMPRKEDVEEAVGLLKEPGKKVILAGRGAHGARQELIALAEKIKAPIILTLPGKGVIPDDHPLCLGGLGLIGTKPALKAMKQADQLIMVGTSFPFTGFLPEQTKTVQIDRLSEQIGKRYPVDVGIAADASETIKLITAMVSANPDQAFLKECQEGMKQWLDRLSEQEHQTDIPIKPQAVIRALQQVTQDNAILSCDVGNVTVWMARHFHMTNQKFIISSWLATLGCGLPGAIAGKIAYPDRQVIAVCGDGGFGMTMNDFVTAVKYELPIIVVVLNNHKIAMIKFEQEVMGNAEFGTNLTNPNFALYAEACGGVGIRVEKYQELESAMQRAVMEKKPVIVDVLVDPNEAPMPAKITFAQAAGYTQHMLKEFLEDGTIDLPPIFK